jgi:hypothetical protein
MKKILLTAALCLTFSFASNAQWRIENTSRNFAVQAEFGYGKQDLHQLKHKFKSEVNWQNPLPNAPIQKLFPANGSFGVSVYYNFDELFRLKASVTYTQTQAYSYYGDYSGSIDIKHDIEVIFLEYGIAKDIFSFSGAALYAEICGGEIVAQYSQSSSKAYALTGENYSWEESEIATGFVIEPSLGMRYKIGVFEINLNESYKFSQASNFGGSSGPVADFSGFTTKAGLAYTFKY